VAEVADSFGVSWPTAHAAVVQERTDAYDTGFVDLAGDQGLLGQVEGRTSNCVVDWLHARTPQFRQAIRYVAIDPAAVYAKAVREALPNATLVVDGSTAPAPRG
jgi:transposase